LDITQYLAQNQPKSPTQKSIALSKKALKEKKKPAKNMLQEEVHGMSTAKKIHS